MVGLGPRRRPSRKGAYCYQNRAQHTDGECLGSMADVPDDLLEQIRYLEKIFTVDKAKLKEVTTQFVKELVKGKSSVLSHRSTVPNSSTGLSVEGGSIVSKFRYFYADVSLTPAYSR